MRLLRRTATIGLFTVLALLYVHQHVELVKMSYAIQYNEKRLAKLLDRNERLGYNIDNLENPSRLEGILQSRKIEIAMPKRGQIVQAARSTRGHQVVREEAMAVEPRPTFNLFELLSLRAEAQAKE